MKVRNMKLKRKKALLAIAFASGALSSTLPSFPESKQETLNPEVRAILKEKKTDSLSRAISLLKYASKHLSEGAQAQVEVQLLRLHDAEIRRSRYKKIRQWDVLGLGDWVLLSEIDVRRHYSSKTNEGAATRKTLNEGEKTLANQAIYQSLRQIANCTNREARLRLYLIASQLFQETGNIEGMRNCDEILERAFQQCERATSIDEIEIDETISVLNQMAHNLIPTFISAEDLKYSPYATASLENTLPKEMSFTEKDFGESEELRLRALAIADRLPPEHHLRRRAHRDLVLWYRRLGKCEKAESEKNVLFDLVGIRDESILYPQPGMCGHDVWWRKAGTVAEIGCGMG